MKIERWRDADKEVDNVKPHDFVSRLHRWSRCDRASSGLRGRCLPLFEGPRRERSDIAFFMHSARRSMSLLRHKQVTSVSRLKALFKSGHDCD